MKSLIPWTRKKENNMLSVFNNSIDDFWSNPFGFFNNLETKISPVEIKNTNKEILVKAEMPGIEEKDIEVTLDNGVLVLKGEKNHENTSDSYSEFSHSSFYREVYVGEGVDKENIKAKYKNGMLSIKLPKNKKETKNIKVKIN